MRDWWYSLGAVALMYNINSYREGFVRLMIRATKAFSYLSDDASYYVVMLAENEVGYIGLEHDQVAVCTHDTWNV